MEMSKEDGVVSALDRSIPACETLTVYSSTSFDGSNNRGAAFAVSNCSQSQTAVFTKHFCWLLSDVKIIKFIMSSTGDANERVEDCEPTFEDTQDFKDAQRGFIAKLSPCIIKNASGKTVWNNDQFDFVYQQSCPETVNPKLWRQAQLLATQGLFQISPSIFQVRGFDISHITFIEGRSGVIVIDPLISCECASAALKFYQNHGQVRPVKAIIYTHSHIDHYGGAAGVLPDGAIPSDLEIIAPDGFVEEALSENVLAGPIMRRRAEHMYGSHLPRSATGQMGVGLAMGTSTGRTSFIPPTTIITETSQKLMIDGVEIVFQLVPNTEAPSEMNMHFPKDSVLLIAECATKALHNITTLRGAQVRDARAWSRYLDETLVMFCERARSDVLFGSHSWPTWGEANIKRFIEEQRDLYGFLHDQTIREMNKGWNGTEIAERMTLPPALQRAWHAQGYYGSVSHNVKGIYQRYMTWFDGAAENLWKWPPAEEGSRYIACMGGSANVERMAMKYMQEGDLRFAATLLGHLVAADQGEEKHKSHHRELLAQVFESLGYGAENATWRNFYLSQALELGQGPRVRGKSRSVMQNFPPNLSLEDWFAGLSVSIDGQSAGEETEKLHVGVQVLDANESWHLILSNGVLTYRRQGFDRPLSAPLVLKARKADLQRVLSGNGTMESLDVQRGNVGILEKILGHAGIKTNLASRL